MKTLKVRLLHDASIPNARWCEPVGWEPTNVVDGLEQDGGSWWDADEEVAGMVWLGNPNEYGSNEVAELNLDDLRVASCGECRIIGKVEVAK